MGRGRASFVLALSLGLASAQSPVAGHISAESLRATVAFLSSPSLEGRDTPSSGLDLAAGFIAARFLSAGLEPAGPDGSYFQTAKLTRVTPDLRGLQSTLRDGSDELRLSAADLSVRSLTALDWKAADVIPLDDQTSTAGPLDGRIVAGSARRYAGDAALLRLQSHHPALILLAGRRDPDLGGASWLAERDTALAPVLWISSPAFAEALADHRPLTLSLHLAAPALAPVAARNVVGLIPGADPVLKSQYILLTAHYDHLGALPGANDNASGIASVIEIGAALASLHPRRSILFLALWGEEEGLLGAYYYTRHPLVPLRDTVANLNLEQLGRTDDSDGVRLNSFALTGQSYSDLPAILAEGLKSEGVNLYKKRGSDSYFDRSDNYAFALAGIVSHTAVVAFEYPDYHAPGDEWRKLDYANMARVDRGIAAALLHLANRPSPPQWNSTRDAELFRNAVR